MRSPDTTQRSHATQVEVYRRLGSGKRAGPALRMSDDAREVAADGIRSRHPAYTAEDVRWALLRKLHGDPVFRNAWPLAPVLDP